MTETEWHNSDDVKSRLCFLETRGSKRQLALFHVACCDSLSAEWGSDHPIRQYLPVVVAIVDGVAPPASSPQAQAILLHMRNERARLESCVDEARGKVRHFVRQKSKEAVAAALLGYAILPDERWWATTTDVDDGLLAAQYSAFDGRLEQVCRDHRAILHDIFGNPFRPVAFSKAWRTDTASSLARRMYETHQFDAMPILADALQDAGCEDESILTHSRGDGIHVRGCWVVDLVLGKA